MCLLQANRTADLVHKLMNISDDPKLKQEVMIRTLENTIIHIYGNIANSGQYVVLLMLQLLVQAQFVLQHWSSLFIGANCMFIVELILHSPRQVDCVAETACYIGYSVFETEIWRRTYYRSLTGI